jgi:hypothetical protein
MLQMHEWHMRWTATGAIVPPNIGLQYHSERGAALFEHLELHNAYADADTDGYFSFYVHANHHGDTNTHIQSVLPMRDSRGGNKLL